MIRLEAELLAMSTIIEVLKDLPPGGALNVLGYLYQRARADEAHSALSNPQGWSAKLSEPSPAAAAPAPAKRERKRREAGQYGELSEVVREALSDGKPATVAQVAKRTNKEARQVGTILKDLAYREKIERVARGVYRRSA